MTRQQRRSKSQRHNYMKSAGYKWYRNGWWEQWRWGPMTVRLAGYAPVYHSDHEEAK